VKRSSQPRTLVEVALVRLARMEDSVSLSQVLDGLGRLGLPGAAPRKPEPASAAPEKKAPTASRTGVEPPPKDSKKTSSEASSPPRGQGNLDLAAIEQSWGEVVDSLQKQALMAGNFLASGRPVGYRDGIIQIAFPRSNAYFKTQVESRHRAAVEKALSEYFQASLRIGCTLAAEPAPEEAKPGDRKAALASGEDVEGVRRLLEAFGGEIV